MTKAPLLVEDTISAFFTQVDTIKMYLPNILVGGRVGDDPEQKEANLALQVEIYEDLGDNFLDIFTVLLEKDLHWRLT